MCADHNQRLRIGLVVLLGVTLAGCNEPSRKPTAMVEVGMRQECIFPIGKEARNAFMEEYRVLKNTQLQLIKRRVVLEAALRQPEIAALEIVRREADDTVVWLQERLQASYPADGAIMEVSLKMPNSAEAAKLLNAVVDAYVHDYVETERAMKHKELADLDAILARKEQEIRKRRMILKRVAEEMGSSPPETLGAKLQLALRALEQQRQQLNRSQADLQRLAMERKMLQADLAKIQKGGDSSSKPDAPDTAAPPTESASKLKERISGLTEKITALTKDVESQTKAMARSEKQFTKIGRSTVELDMMHAELEDLEAVRKRIVARRQALEVELNARPRVRVLQPAVP